MSIRINFFELNNLSDLINSSQNEKMILCDGLTSLDVLNLCSAHSAQHIVQKSNIKIDDEIKLSKMAVDYPEIFFKYPLSIIFGEAKPSEETEKMKTSFSHSLSTPTEIDHVLENVKLTLSQYRVRQSLSGDICLAADELISNALFNAPYTTKEKDNCNIVRDFSKISVDPIKKPHFFLAVDNERIVIGCTDYYGRLDANKLLERIKLCYQNNPGEMINFSSGGAGIGSYLIFESCSSYYVAVDPGKMTTICSTYPLNMSSKKRNETPKNVHIILSLTPDSSYKVGT